MSYGANVIPWGAGTRTDTDTGSGTGTDSGEEASAPAGVPLLALPPGGMLCDEPGLGKTITMLAVILRRIHGGSSSTSARSSPALIVVPEALRNQWAAQIDTHLSPALLESRTIFVDDDIRRPLPR